MNRQGAEDAKKVYLQGCAGARVAQDVRDQNEHGKTMRVQEVLNETRSGSK